VTFLLNIKWIYLKYIFWIATLEAVIFV